MAHDGVLLIVGDLSENKQKDAFSNAVVKGLEFWNSPHDLNEAVKQFVASAPCPVHQDGFDADDRSMRFSALECELEVLINPGFNTLSFAIEVLMRTELRHRLIVFAGPVAAGSGDWLLRDSLLSPERFAALFKEIINPFLSPDAELRVAGPLLADWRNLKTPPVTAVKPDDYQASNDSADNSGFIQIAAFLADLIALPSIVERFSPSTVVGNVRFEKPTMYVFPEGNGDSALLGVEGFNLLVNSGYAQSPGFWQFVKHVDRLDALLLTHWGLDNVAGLRNFLSRKTHSNISPELGFALVPSCRPSAAPTATAISNGDTDNSAAGSDLEVNLTAEAKSILAMLKDLDVATEDVRRQGTTTINATVLYSKIGHGTLELYPLNPIADAKDLKEFQAQLSKGTTKFSTVKVGNAFIPLPNVTSMAALLVWKPAKPTDAIIRILFTGNCPQAKIIEAIEKLKHLDFLKHPTYCHADGALKRVASAPPVKSTTSASKPAPAPVTSRNAPTPSTASHKSASPDADGDKPNTSRVRASVGVPKRPKTAPAEVASPKEDKSAPKPVIEKKAPAVEKKAQTVEKKAPAVEKKAPAVEKKAPAVEKKAPAVVPAKRSAAPPAPARNARETGENVSKTVPRVAASKSSAPVSDSNEKAPSKSRPTTAPIAGRASLPAKKAPTASTKTASTSVSVEKVEEVKKESSVDVEAVKQEEFEKEGSLPISENSCLSEVDVNANPDHEDEAHHTLANHQNVDLVNAPMEASLYEPEALDNDEDQHDEIGDEHEGLNGEEPHFDPVQQWEAPQALPALPDNKKPASSRPLSVASAVEKAVNYGPVTPIYVNLAYVPAHGDQRYADVEFFKRVRARYYVLSAVEANPLTLDAVLDGKEAWGTVGRDLSVTVVPTYDNQLVLRWLNANRERLEDQSVDLTPAAARCKIQLQDHDDGMAFAYRIEF